MSAEVESSVREENRAFVRDRLKLHCTENPSEIGLRAAVLLAVWCDGWHHVPSPQLVNWEDAQCITIRITRALATVDFFDLTKLVFLAHDEALRVELGPAEQPDLADEDEESVSGGILLRITARKRGGEFYEDHPTLEQAVQKHRDRFPESGVAK